MGNRLKDHLLLFLVFLFFPVFVFPQEHKSIASLYIDQAVITTERGEIDRAYELLLTALSFMPENSDTLYLLAQLDSTVPSGFYRSVERSREALSINVWNRFSPDACRILLAELMVRTGQYREAESILSQPMFTDVSGAGADYYLIKAKALRGNEKKDESVQLLEGAVRKYSHDPRLKQLLLRLSPSFRGRLVSEYLEGRYHFNHTETVLLDLIRQPLDTDIKMNLIDIYEAAGGTSPWIYVELLSVADGQTGLQTYIDSLYTRGGIGKGDLIDKLIPLIFETPLYEQLYDLSKNYTGTINFDSNEDGYNEIEYRFTDGLPRSVSVDQNQDGVYEYDVIFEEGLPVSVTGVIDDPEVQSVVLRYSDYPYTENILVRDQEKTVTYSMPPGVFSYPLFDFRFLENKGPLNLPRLNPYRPQVTRAFVENKASSIRVEHIGSSEMVELWEYLPGQKNWQKKELDEKGRIVKKVYFQDGKPVLAGVDSDMNGEFEVTYQYNQEGISSILFDENGDMIPEYSMVFGNEDIRSWDFNSDSIIDCREQVKNNGQILRTFSSSLDGVFDMEILYDRNRIVWVSREGRKKMVSLDPEGGFYWVGEKPPMKLLSLPPSGVHVRDGYTISVFNQFGHTYVEVIE